MLAAIAFLRQRSSASLKDTTFHTNLGVQGDKTAASDEVLDMRSDMSRHALTQSKGEVSSDDECGNDFDAKFDVDSELDSTLHEWEDLCYNAVEDAREEECDYVARDHYGKWDEAELEFAVHKRGGRFVRQNGRSASCRQTEQRPGRRRASTLKVATKPRRRESKHDAIVQLHLEARKARVERSIGGRRVGVQIPIYAEYAPTVLVRAHTRPVTSSTRKARLGTRAMEREGERERQEEEAILEAVIAEGRQTAQATGIDLLLSEQLMRDMMTRELTPEDYELLLRLDEAVAKRTFTEADLVSLPTSIHHHTAAGNTVEIEPESCRVCLCDFEESEEKMKLPCGHEFHKTCIVQWLTCSSVNCPVDNLQVQLSNNS